MGSAAARLPGVRIDTAVAPVADALPRMDVAVFVGFTARGPVHRPVAIEGLAQYQTIFGEDLALALDLPRGERVYANLGPAVRAFFSNGGRRCWVIRVARTAGLEAAWCRVTGRTPVPRQTAVANCFAVPGVLALTTGGLEPARAQARSLGSWSDPLQVNTALLTTGFALTGCTRVPAPPGTIRLRLRTDASLVPGDLIELGAGVTAAPASTRFFAICEGPVALGHEAILCAGFAPLATPAAGAVGSARVPGLSNLSVMAILETPDLPGRPFGTPAPSRLRFTGAGPVGLAEGRWLRWAGGGRVVWLRADRRLGLAPGSGTGLVVEGPAWREKTLAMPSPVPTRAAVLTLDLRVLGGPDSPARRTGLGLTPTHPAAWWQSSSDDRWYAAATRGTQGAAPATLAASGPADTFPLAALDAELDTAVPRAWIPLGVESLFGQELGPLPQTGNALDRDGLSRFDAEIFLDPDLAASETATLMDRADYLRFVADSPRDLYGIHGALALGGAALFNEASLIAVPDAVQPGWKRRHRAAAPAPRPVPPAPPSHWTDHRGPCAADAPAAALTGPDFGRFLDCGTRRLVPPVLTGPTRPVSRGSFRLSWSLSEPAAVYALEESQTDDFADAREVYRGTALSFQVQTPREGNVYYRVSAWSGIECSHASNTLAVAVRDDQWVARTWATDTGPGAEQLLRVHQALLRLAAASGELFAVLSLPRHFRAPEAIRYAARLRASFPHAASVDGGAWQEGRALSYGALYHPWAQYAQTLAPATGTPDASARHRIVPGTPRVCPPDGLALGVLAARALGRGAWIAPANEPLKDLVALTPPIDPAAWLALQEARINLIRDEPRGFLVLSAATLSSQEDWQSISVRRLFALLRRLALRRGLSYCFEPNDDVLRRAVERGFTGLLTDLFRRGAFAGATADDAFRVVTGDALTTAADREAGRFLVELRVAPATPLHFLGVRLVQHGEHLSVMEAD